MKLAIYDFDGTYMKTEVLRKVYDFWKIKKLNKKAFKKNWRKVMITYVFYQLRLFGWTKEKFRKNAMTLTANLFKTLNQSELDLFLDELYVYLQDQINDDLKQQLQIDKQNGYYTVLLSGNFDCILEPFKQEGFDEVIGTLSRVHGKMMDTRDINIIISDRKAKTIMEKYPKANLKESIAYADSDYDLPVLELVGEAIAYHPDNQLLEIAEERGYQIWKKPGPR